MGSDMTFYFYWDYNGAEFQVECSLSKPRAATNLDPAEPPEIEIMSVRQLLGMELGVDILGLLPESVLVEIELQSENYVDGWEEECVD